MSTDTIDRIEHEIAEEKDALRYNVGELKERAREVVDWRTQVERHPLALMGAAAVGGLLLASVLRPGPRSLRRLGALAGSMAPIAGRLIAGRMRKPLRRRATDTVTGQVADLELPKVKRAVRSARRTAQKVASRVADRLNVPTAWEESAPRIRQPRA